MERLRSPPDRNLYGTRSRSSPKTAAVPWPVWFEQNGRRFGGRFGIHFAACPPLSQNNPAERLRKGLRLLLKFKIDAQH
jgi:hypothetical protein